MRLQVGRRSFAPTILIFAICVANLLTPLVWAQETKPKIRIAIPSPSICCLHLFAAQQWKVFEDNGLDVEIIQMRPQVANAAMVGGEIHYFAGVGPNSVAATLRGMSSRAVLRQAKSLSRPVGHWRSRKNAARRSDHDGFDDSKSRSGNTPSYSLHAGRQEEHASIQREKHRCDDAFSEGESRDR